MNTTKTINLEEYRTPNSKIFTGRDRGRDVRERSKIDELETQYEKIEIIIPDNIFSINPSFFEEFIIKVVQKLGKKVFFERFSFKSIGEYDCTESLDEAVDRVLRSKTALSH